MRLSRSWLFIAPLCALLLACSSSDTSRTSDSSPLTATEPAGTPAPPPTPTPQPIRLDIQATRLQIPSVNIDAQVQKSMVVPYVDVPIPGCPVKPSGDTTVTVPNEGIATPVDSLDGFDNKAWIYGHSRWIGRMGVFFRLQDLKVGDELLLDGTDRKTGEKLTGQKFVVDALYLTDTDTGDELLEAKTPDQIPTKPMVILQTSVREDGPGKQWILSRQELMPKVMNRVSGNIDDPCKYLLLFVTAQAV
jgi:hypothetical protein